MEDLPDLRRRHNGFTTADHPRGEEDRKQKTDREVGQVDNPRVRTKVSPF